MKPLATSMTNAAKTFVENPVCDFLRDLGDSLVLHMPEDVPKDDSNTYPIKHWPLQACAIPRSIFNKMFRDYMWKYRHVSINETSAGMLLSKALNFYPKGIPEAYNMKKTRLWKMASPRGEIDDLSDRAFCIPAVLELRGLVEKMAGESIEWSEIDLDEKTDAVVVDLHGKKDERF